MQTLHILNRRTLSNDLEEIEAAKKLVRGLPITIDENELGDMSSLIDRIALKFQSRETVEIDEIIKTMRQTIWLISIHQKHAFLTNQRQ